MNTAAAKPIVMLTTNTAQDMAMELTLAFGRAPDTMGDSEEWGSFFAFELGIPYLNAGVQVEDAFRDGRWAIKISVEECSRKVRVSKGASIEQIAMAAKRAADKFVASRAK